MFLARAAHGYAGTSPSSDPTPHRGGPGSIDPTFHGCLVDVRALVPKIRICRVTLPSTRRRTSGELSINGSAFLPAHYQGTKINDSGYLPNIKPQAATSLQRRQINLIQSMNRDFGSNSSAPDQLEGVIQSYELAFKMQGKGARASRYLQANPSRFWMPTASNREPQGAFARQCLMARRLSETGVRFVEICQPGWDHHSNLHKGLIKNCQETDQSTAALLADLEQRGMLEDTLVLFGSEFGRLPTAQGPDGRDHNITWLSDVVGRRGREAGILLRG